MITAITAEQRGETLRQIGGMNIAAISGGRVRAVEYGVELPVSSGYSVRVSLAANDTYIVERIFRRGGNEWVKGRRTEVYCDEVGNAAYYASCFRSHDAEEWVNAR